MIDYKIQQSAEQISRVRIQTPMLPNRVNSTAQRDLSQKSKKKGRERPLAEAEH